MTRFSHILLATTALVAVSACSSNDSPKAVETPVVVTPVTPATSELTLANTAAGTSLAVTARAGLEAFNFTNGAAAAAESAAPAGSFQSNPTASYVKTATGFNLTLPSGRTANFVTTTGSTQATTGPQSFPIGSGATQTAQRFQTTVNGGTNQVSVSVANAANSNLQYTTYGTWVESAGLNNPISAGTFATGVVSTSVPTTGTATYNGSLTGFAITPTSGVTITGGAVALNANFAANTVSGAVTNITTQRGGVTPQMGTMNSVNLTGGTISGASFSGVASAAAAAGTMVNVSGATGSFGGKFYGPAAAEAAGSLTMTGGGNTVVGVFGAKK